MKNYRFDCLCAALCLPVLSIGLYFGTVKQLVAGGCPIVFDLSGNGKIDITGHNSTQEKLYTLFSIGRYVKFDIFASGEEIEIDWLQPNKDAFLVDIREGFPERATGRHLFGTASSKDDGESYDNGFKKLATLDADMNGLVEGAELDGLALWRDNGDAIMDKEEVLQLSDYDVTSIPVQHQTKSASYGFLSTFAYADTGSGRIYIEDVWFMNSGQPTDTDIFVGRLLSVL